MLKAIVAYLHLHWTLVMVVFGVYVALGNLLARKYPALPAKTAPLWKRALYFAFVNLPHMGAALQGKSLLGFRFAFPIIDLTLRAGEQAVNPLKIVPFVLIATMSFSGCATLKGKPLADQVQIVKSDAAQIAADVKANCGPQLAALADVVRRALLTATSSPDALGIIMAAAQLLPEGVQAGEGVWCVIRTVRDDLKKMSTPDAAKAAAVADDLMMRHAFEGGNRGAL